MIKRNAIPEPTTKRAVLMSNTPGVGFARHDYVETLACSSASGPAWEHIYACAVSGARRRWGLETRLEVYS